MNYTFLPIEAQVNLKREYRVRISIVLLFFISAAGIVGIASLFPAYIYSTLEERTHLNRVAELKKTTDSSTVSTIQKQLASAGALIGTVNDTIQPNVYSNLVASIVDIRRNIKINSISVEHPSTKVLNVVISGVAPTRADLLSFKVRLQNLPPKVAVDLPVSALAQEKNVSFSIQVNQTLP